MMMNDVFNLKKLEPMLISEQQTPFNDPNYFYELKFDGIRSLLYSDADGVEIRNKRNKSLTYIMPELTEVYKQIKGKAILDGELIVIKDSKPDFYEMQKRALMNNYSKIQLISQLYPITFIAYDILYLDGKELIDLPLTQRKKILQQVLKETPRIAISKVIEEKGIELFEITKQQGLEGVIAKKKQSKYFYGKRTKEWIKFKNMIDDDYVVLGYIPKQHNNTSLIIGQYDNNELVYIGHVTFWNLKKLFEYPIVKIEQPYLKEIPKGNEEAIWLEPNLVCIVEYMYHQDNRLRQPVFKAFRDDKDPKKCIVKANFRR